MSFFSDWPEVAPFLPAIPATGEPPELHVEHAVWGKAHGARSDFRWIARSPGFPIDSDLPRQLNFGAEDQPVRAQLWRNLNGRCYAVSCYPSRAADWSGRTGFIEKQVLSWKQEVGLPAALGALLLLPRIARETDKVWWDRCEDAPWQDPGFSLPLPTPEPIPVQETEVEEALARGIEALDAVLRADTLEAFFLRLLGRLRPAALTGLSQPLPPEALAALLLPLPCWLAEGVSLAGWISGRASREDLARWDAAVFPPELAGTAESEVRVSPADRERAPAWARKLLRLPEPNEKLTPPAFSVAEAGAPFAASAPPAADPPKSRHHPLAVGLPGRTIKLEPPPKECSSLLYELHDFACAVDRRWINPEAPALKKQLREVLHDKTDKSVAAPLLQGWIEALAPQRPEDVDEEQWKVKLDLLRSAAVVLCPSAWPRIGLPQSRRIPALFFTLLFESTRQCDEALGGLGEASLRQIAEQSLDCIASRWTRKVQEIMDRWRRETNRADVRRSLEIAKGIQAPRAVF